MKKNYFLLLFFLFSFIFFLNSCCSRYVERTDTIISDEIIIPPKIVDTVFVNSIDSIMIEGIKIVEHDTVIQVQYFPKLKKFYINVKPDTIIRKDTVSIITSVTELEEKSWFQVNGLYLIAALIIILLIVYFLKRKN